MIRLLALLLLLPAEASAQSLYEGRAYVTGTRVETRDEAVMTAFRRVLAKVSGNPALAEDDRITALAPLLPSLVLDLAYLDRLTDVPHHDEQGTRDRPYDLVVHFDPERIDGALRLLGDRPWPLPSRRRIAVKIMIDDRGARFLLTADGENDERHRQALLAAADRFGLQVALALSDGPAVKAPAMLEGTLRWSEEASGWVGTWELTDPLIGTGLGMPRAVPMAQIRAVGAKLSWQVSGVSFDEAYRDAVGGAAARMSGHGK
jgi:hypothetical protein